MSDKQHKSERSRNGFPRRGVAIAVSTLAVGGLLFAGVSPVNAALADGKYLVSATDSDGTVAFAGWAGAPSTPGGSDGSASGGADGGSAGGSDSSGTSTGGADGSSTGGSDASGTSSGSSDASGGGDSSGEEEVRIINSSARFSVTVKDPTRIGSTIALTVIGTDQINGGNENYVLETQFEMTAEGVTREVVESNFPVASNDTRTYTVYVSDLTNNTGDVTTWPLFTESSYDFNMSETEDGGRSYSGGELIFGEGLAYESYSL